jgi:putative flippase GtrA
LIDVKLSFRRWGVFNLVGLGGFLLQIATIALLTRSFHWSSVVATAIGLEAAALLNFLGHSRWTWSDQPEGTPGGCAARFRRYQVAKTASLGANLAITTALAAVTGLPVELSNAVAVVACALPNYFVADRLVFSIGPRRV